MLLRNATLRTEKGVNTVTYLGCGQAIRFCKRGPQLRYKEDSKHRSKLKQVFS